MSEPEIIFGKNSVESLLEFNTDRVNKILILNSIKFDAKIKKIYELAKSNGIVIQNVPKEKLNSITQEVHQGVIAFVSPISYTDFDDFISTLPKNKNSLLVMLDGLEDPHNLGAIIRTSVAAGAQGIIIPKRRNAQITSIVEKTSAGAVQRIPIMQVNNLNNTIERLKKENFWIIGAEGSAEKYYYEVNYDMNCTIVLGGENQGISELVKKNCDFLVKIPMIGEINSLNVSNAAAIVIYETIRQKLTSKN